MERQACRGHDCCPPRGTNALGSLQNRVRQPAGIRRDPSGFPLFVPMPRCCWLNSAAACQVLACQNQRVTCSVAKPHPFAISSLIWPFSFALSFSRVLNQCFERDFASTENTSPNSNARDASQRQLTANHGKALLRVPSRKKRQRAGATQFQDCDRFCCPQSSSWPRRISL